jgi:dTDP-4-amino-4,6-dideoxygalactose transaminase
VDEITVVAPGINGKMNEISAAFGLLQLKGIDGAVQKRKIIDACYGKRWGRQRHPLPFGRNRGNS